ncbi:MAG: ErfK/YbiS/YcfS/YnhG family protein [Firmicutes bacterium]|nr:ErfK/YbiS/YcfS/YnhG family protein [Bacillota bacterium]
MKVMITALHKLSRLHLIYGLAIFMFLGIIIGAANWEYFDELELAAIPNQPTAKPTGMINLIINVPERTLEIYSDAVLYKSYRIAVGKSKSPTPVGEWMVVWKDYGWGSGFGTRWIGLNVPWGIYGIHGTNNPWSIGRPSSHGCIRMRNKDVEELFEWVPIGTEVKIVGRQVKVERKLQLKMTGADVVVVQLKLKELGYLASRADGIFGQATEAAVKAYQVDNGLIVTGVVDEQVIQLLGI